MKPGDLVRIQRAYVWKYDGDREWARTQSPLLVLAASTNGNIMDDDGLRGTIKICNEENLWVPKKYFEVVSCG